MGAPVFGSRNGAAKLDHKAVAEIRLSELSGRVLGKKYGVDRTTIDHVRRRETWGHQL
jgi:hypothetical protein